MSFGFTKLKLTAQYCDSNRGCRQGGARHKRPLPWMDKSCTRKQIGARLRDTGLPQYGQFGRMDGLLL